MKLYPIETQNFKLDAGAVFGVVPKSIWHKLYPVDEKNLCNCSNRCLLVETANKKILIDTGIGNKQSYDFLKYYFLNGEHTLESSIKKAGFATDDITDVVFTHLHFDHCGGAVKYNNDKTKLELVFKNAIHWVSKSQWEWAMQPNRRERPSYLKENILPLKESGNLQFIEKPIELYPNFFIRIYNGHTEGQLIPMIKFNGKTIVYAADFIPSCAHIPVSFISGYDTRPLVALKEKEEFLEEAVANNYILFFEHDLYSECCTLTKTEKGVRAKDSLKLTNALSTI